jgi:hypothetical protein
MRQRRGAPSPSGHPLNARPVPCHCVRPTKPVRGRPRLRLPRSRNPRMRISRRCRRRSPKAWRVLRVTTLLDQAGTPIGRAAMTKRINPRRRLAAAGWRRGNDGGQLDCAGQQLNPYARPAALTRCDGSIPSFDSAFSYFVASSDAKTISGSVGQFSHALAAISLSSWPGDQPA